MVTVVYFLDEQAEITWNWNWGAPLDCHLYIMKLLTAYCQMNPTCLDNTVSPKICRYKGKLQNRQKKTYVPITSVNAKMHTIIKQ